MSQASIPANRGLEASVPPAEPFVISQKHRRISADFLLYSLCLGSAMIVIGMLLALVVVLAHGAMPSIRQFGLGFLIHSEWRASEIAARGPNGKILYDEDGDEIMSPPTFGALAVIYGTVTSAGLALLLAVPPSLAAAIFLIRIAPRWLAGPVSFLIEFLAAIPSLAYGLWGMFVLVPLLRDRIEPTFRLLLHAVPGFHQMFYNAAGKLIPLTGSDLFAGGIILGIMILPIITAVSRDVLSAVPRAQVEGSIALGATWWQSAKEMLHFSKSGLFGAVMLGLARAAGETMAVAMVIGINTQIKPSLFAPAQTMSSLLAVSFGEVSDEVERSSLVQVALVLLVMSLLFNVVARYLVVGKAIRPAAAA